MIEVKGISEAIEGLKKMQIALSQKELKMLLRGTLRIYVSSIRKQAPIANRTVREFWGNRMNIKPGSLKRSVRAIISKKSPPGELHAYIGPMKLSMKKRAKTENNTLSNDGWFRHFVTRGTAGYTIKRGKNKGKYMPGQAANDFVDRGARAADGAATARFEKDFDKLVNNKMGWV